MRSDTVIYLRDVGSDTAICGVTVMWTKGCMDGKINVKIMDCDLRFRDQESADDFRDKCVSSGITVGDLILRPPASFKSVRE